MNYKFYKAKGAVYILKKNNIPYIIGILFFLVMEIVMLSNKISDKNQIIYRIFPLIPILLYSAEIGRTVSIDTQNKTIAASYFGILFKRSYTYSEFVRFVITKHTVNFIKDGISIAMEFKKNGKCDKIKLNKYRKSAKAELLLNETKTILQ